MFFFVIKDWVPPPHASQWFYTTPSGLAVTSFNILVQPRRYLPFNNPAWFNRGQRSFFYIHWIQQYSLAAPFCFPSRNCSWEMFLFIVTCETMACSHLRCTHTFKRPQDEERDLLYLQYFVLGVFRNPALQMMCYFTRSRCFDKAHTVPIKIQRQSSWESLIMDLS